MPILLFLCWVLWMVASCHPMMAPRLSLLTYRALFGYIKWAFPVNILEENKDRATGHRLMLGAIVSSLIVSGAKSVLGTVAGI